MRARRMWAKAAVLATLIGAAVGVALYLAMDQISREWIAVIDQWLDWPLALIKVALPAASVEVTTSTLAFVSVAAALTGFLMVGGRRPLVDRLWPEPPGILNLTLFRQNADPDDPRFAGRTFVGRTEEMRALRRFAGDAGGAVPRWCALTAPHGIGKTRLALEWLDRLQKRGWDAGLLGSGKTLQDIERTHFRRKAAIVIDEALKDKDLWQKQAERPAGGAPMRAHSRHRPGADPPARDA